MTGKLGVFTPQLGTVSETFIRRHLEDVMPGETVAVARMSEHPTGGRWQFHYPVLYLDRFARRLPVRLARRVGLDESRIRDGAVSRFLRKHGVSVVLGEYLDQFVDFVPLMDRLRLPYVVQGHGIDVSAALRTPGMAKRYLAFGSARAILTRSEFHRRRLIQIGLPPERIHVNPGGVDLPDAAPVRGPQASKRLLAIGRMVSKKGPMYLLEAFHIASEKDAELSLDIVGDGPLLSGAREFARSHGLGERVRFHGAGSSEIKDHLLRECGVFVQHSVTDPVTGDEEGLPAAIQEAMANAMTVISTRHSGIPEAIEDGVTGMLVEEGDVRGMAASMLRVAASGALASKLGAAARAKAADLYTWDSERSRLLNYLSGD